ncbi:MAG: hypothetical protein HUU20_06975 [Pirellulales bacterium]|nr:hypothetical protein [Pirellulales bacterium]
MMNLIRVVALWLVCAAMVQAEPLTLPRDQRPEWLRRDGIVMAGSWEPLLFRVRRDGAETYTPTEEQIAAYRREHSAEMVAQLKDLGVNFVMAHCFKGGGLEAERESMADAVQFAKLCRDAGLRVGVYCDSATLMWDLFFKEKPEAKDWIVLGPDGKPLTYGRATYRYFRDRNHPEAEKYYQKVVRFAVEEIKTDLVHLDNYFMGPGWDSNSVERFRSYLGKTFSPEELRKAGVTDLASVKPPQPGADGLLRYAWADFTAQSLADSYRSMGRFARSLRPGILMECNPGPVRPTIHLPVDHGRLIQGGEAYWDESGAVVFRDGKLSSHIRTFKVGRRMNNMVFAYVTSPREAAESMAFNLDCLGAICWFEYGKLVERPGVDKPMSAELTPSVRFFHRRRDLFRDAEVVADAAVLRSFPSQVFGGPEQGAVTAAVEEALILGRVPFQILYDHQLTDLDRYRTLVLAGCVAMSDEQIESVRRYVQAGGRLAIVGPAATHDPWMRLRGEPAFADLPEDRVVRAKKGADYAAVVGSACGGLSATVIGPSGLCAEFTSQPNRRLIHLVNYREDGPAADVSVEVGIPEGRKVRTVSLASPDHEKDLPVEANTREGKARFVVPGVKVYEIAVVELE